MRKIIIPIPTGNSDADKTERAHLLGSRWATTEKGIPNGMLLANRVYSLSDDGAAAFVRKGVARYVGEDGKMTDEQAPTVAATVRPGTQAWKDLPADQRVGSEEWRELQMQKALDEASVAEAKLAEKALPAPVDPKVAANKAAADKLAADQEAARLAAQSSQPSPTDVTPPKK